MPEPTTMMAIAELLKGVGQFGGLFGDDSADPSKTVNFQAWADILNQMRGQQGVYGGRESGLFGQAQGAIQNALSGNMGLSPQAMQMMSQRLNRTLDPSFAMQRDTLRQSINPRISGSGASAALMSQLMGQQAQSRSLGQADIQIQDLLARHSGQMAGLQGVQNLYGLNQNALMNLISQIAGHTRHQTQGFMG